MDYLTRAEYEHEALRVMLAVQRELLTKLAEARGVNLLHLENVLRFWREFFCREHLAAEEEFLFEFLFELDRPAGEGLAADHERLRQNLDELERICNKLRMGIPNSGREFLAAGEKFIAALENHLHKENSLFAELVLEKTEPEWPAGPFPPQEETARLTGLFSLLDNLSREYLGKEYKAAWTERWQREETDRNGGTIDRREEERALPSGGQEEEQEGEEQREEQVINKKQNTWREEAGIGGENEKI